MSESRFEGDDLAVAPDIDRRPVHTRDFTGGARGAAEGATDGSGKFRRFFDVRFHSL